MRLIITLARQQIRSLGGQLATEQRGRYCTLRAAAGHGPRAAGYSRRKDAVHRCVRGSKQRATGFLVATPRLTLGSSLRLRGPWNAGEPGTYVHRRRVVRPSSRGVTPLRSQLEALCARNPPTRTHGSHAGCSLSSAQWADPFALSIPASLTTPALGTSRGSSASDGEALASCGPRAGDWLTVDSMMVNA